MQKFVIHKYCNSSPILSGGQTWCLVLKLQCRYRVVFVEFKVFLKSSKSKKWKDPKWETKGTHKWNNLNKKLLI